MKVSFDKLALVAVLLLALAGSSGAVVVNAQTQPVFEPADCPFMADANVECGYVTVTENRADPDGGTIRIALVIFRGDDSAAPVMLLSGGPGEITTPNAGILGALFQGLVGGRTLVMFDQRGVGRSEPALSCPEWIETQFSLLAPETTPEQALEANYNALLECAAQLEADGINLSAYNSLENAADVADIARALGFDQVNLLGVSYGSLLAQHVMRDYPQMVRAVVIDSVLPLEESFFVNSIDTAFAALEDVLDACAADPACAEAYPNLRETLFESINRYNAEPLPITITNPLTGDTYDSLLTGDTIVGAIVLQLYITPAIPALPRTITAVAEGDLAAAEAFASQILAAFYALERGMQFSVQCAEDTLLVTEQDLLERYSALPPEFRGRADLEAQMEYSPLAICEAWPVDRLDVSVKQPVVSDIPTLALGGEFDPVTPPAYAERVAADLENVFVYTLPGVGHSVSISSTCAADIIRQFLDDPTSEPDASCIDSMGISFQTPDMEIALEPFSSETFAISGVIPAGWQELAPGTYAESMTGSVVLIQQAAPLSLEQAQGLLSQQFGIDEFPEPYSTFESGDLLWALYETPGPQGLIADVALAQDGGTVYIIVLLSSAADNELYYNGAFLPAVAALTRE